MRKTDYAVSEFHTYYARQIIQDHDHLSMTATLIRTNILIIASSLVEWCRVSFLDIRDQGSMESRSQSFSSTFICNIFLSKSAKPNTSSQKQIVTEDLTHLNAFVSISECVHRGLLVALQLGEHCVRLVQSHLRITMSTFAGIWTPWSFSGI